ncbi:MAG: hypothetical protein V8R95_06645 [Faecalibacterium sp.]
MSDIRLPIRQLVEFLLRSGSIDSRFAGFDRALEGARIHRRLQKAAGEGYAAEVPLCADYTVDGIRFTLEGRADGIFTNETGVVTIDEIKTTAVPEEEICEDMNPCHWAQGMVYGAIYSAQESLPAVDVRLTYYQIDTDRILRFVRHFSRQELEQFLHKLLHRYLPWAQRQLAWQETRSGSLTAMRFPFEAYRPGQRALAGEVWRACTAAPSKKGTRLFCQAPTGIGKTMSALFPALKAMGSGCGEKLFYLTARNTTQAAAEDAIARLRAVQPDLALRSVTLTAKEKACLHPDAEGHPVCLPEVCPYANGYYDRIKNALAALLDGSGQFSRAALADTARQFTVCPFELGLDLSEWCDVVIGDYNYLFDPVVHLKRFFDTSGDWLFLIDEAHNLPDRARAMYSARFCKSSLTDAKRTLGKGKSALKTALTKADKAMREARQACVRLAPRRHAEDAPGEPAQTSLLPEPDASGVCPAGAVVCAGRHGVFAGAARRTADTPAGGAGPFAGLAGRQPGSRRPPADAGALFCGTGSGAGCRTVRQPLCDPAHRPRQRAGIAAALSGPGPLCGCQPFHRAQCRAVQRHPHPARLLPQRAGLCRRPGCGAGKPVSRREPGAVLPARHLHPLP